MSAQRGGQAPVAWLAERLSDRDWQVVEAVNRLRMMSGNQLERVYFAALTGHTRAVVRGRVLRRLVHWRVLAVLPRRIGGAMRGSSGLIYVLDVAGARLCAERQAAATDALSRMRHPSAPTERSVRHTVAVSELYVSLVEQARERGAQLVSFEAEPESWWPNGLGGLLKPDAYGCLELGNVRDHWWVEVDLATESLPTIKRKLLAYLDFVERGQLGPGNVVPRVLVSGSTAARCPALRSVIVRLPAPADGLFVVQVSDEAPTFLLQTLQE